MGSLRGAEPGLLGRVAQPGPLLGLLHVVVVVAGGAAVDPAQALDRLGGGAGPRGHRAPHGPRRERLQLGLRQSVRRRIELGVAHGGRAERIEARRPVAVLPDGRGQGPHGRHSRRIRHRAPCPVQDSRHRAVQAGVWGLQALEEGPAGGVNRFGVSAEALVQVKHIPGVGAMEPSPEVLPLRGPGGLNGHRHHAPF